ncbi:MAG: hypothetical protein AAF720_11825 [Pseudomonadota bacterium]
MKQFLESAILKAMVVWRARSSFISSTYVQSALSYWVLLVAFAFVITLYRDFIFAGRVFLISDNAQFSIPMMDILKKSLAEGTLPFWSNLIYGGHPIYAEGQTGVFNPVVLVALLLFEPQRAVTAIHFSSQMLMAYGVFLMCRELGRSKSASGFAAFVATFSSFALDIHSNHAPALAMSMVPFVIWTFERLYRLQTLQSTAWFALAFSLSLLSGYPPFTYSIVIFLSIRILSSSINLADRTYLLSNFRRLFFLALFAIVLATGLSAAQLAPLIEASIVSNRSDGVERGLFPLILGILRGIVFSFNYNTILENNPHVATKEIKAATDTLSTFGSGFVFLLVLLSSTKLKHKHLWGYFIAVGLMLIATAELNLRTTPLSGFVKVISGHFVFRTAGQQTLLFVLGATALVAFTIDLVDRAALTKKKFTTALATLVLSYIVVVSWSPYVSSTQIASIIVAFCILILVRNKSIRVIFFVFLLAVEVVTSKFQPFLFYPPDNTKPVFTEKIETGELAYKFVPLKIQRNFGRDPTLPRGDISYRRTLETLTPSTNIQWDIPSIRGSMALYSNENVLAKRLIYGELENHPSLESSPKLRLADVLSVKYVGADLKQPPPKGMKEIASIKGVRLKLLENNNALPPVRFYKSAECVPSPEDITSRIHTSETHTLYLSPECPHSLNDEAKSGYPVVNGKVLIDAAARIEKVKIEPGHYVFRVETTEPGWLFITDRHFPGWEARVNGEATKIYSAHILGKAIQVSKGVSDVKISFQSKTIRYGFISSVLTLLVVFAIGFGLFPGLRGYRFSQAV